MDRNDVDQRQIMRLRTPSDLGARAMTEMSAALTALLADMFALYFKTKSFHWHMSGPYVRDYHLMLDEQAEQIFATTDTIAGRVREIGGTTLRSIGHVSRLQRILDNDADYVTPNDMLTELANDNKHLVGYMRATHATCADHNDAATASLIENWIDDGEQRVWFLYEFVYESTRCRRRSLKGRWTIKTRSNRLKMFPSQGGHAAVNRTQSP
jgi:starvation-inducible DNA-binding protein